MAAQVGEDPEDIFELARHQELRSLFTRTDLQVPAPVSVPPTPLAVAQRSHGAGSDIDLQRRRLESPAKKIEMDTGPDEPRQLSLQERLLELRRRKMLWDAPVEARSLTDFPRDRNGHAIDWHPWRR